MLPRGPEPRKPVPPDGLAQATAEFNADANRYEPLWDSDTIMDQRAVESAAMDSLERGFIPRDLADRVSRASLVGHLA